MGELRDRFVNARYHQIERRVFDAVRAKLPLQEFESQLEDFAVERYDDFFERYNALLWYDEADRMTRMLAVRLQTQFENGPNEIGIKFARYPDMIFDPASMQGAQVVVDGPELRVGGRPGAPDDHLVFEVARTMADTRSDRPLRLSLVPGQTNYTAEQLDGVRFARAYYIPPHEPFDRCRAAMESIRDDPSHRLRRVLVAVWSGNHDMVLEDYDANPPLIDFDATNDWDLQRLLNKLDESQQRAVKEIVLAKVRPYPYVVVGIPGSGKTHTVIEAICQILRRSKGSKRVLVCAPSESYLRRLYKFIVSRGRLDEADIDASKVPKIQRNSGGESSVKSIWFATTFRSAEFDDKYFDYVFLDEASGAHQPETLIPWCKLKDDGLLVMSGDPSQLGTGPRNRIANKHGMRLSMMGLFLNKEAFEDRSPRDWRYITSLVKSYRSDPRILRWANRVHYQRRIAPGPYRTFDEVLLGLRVFYPVVTVDVRNIRQNYVLENTCMEYLDKLYHQCHIKPHRIGVVAMTDYIGLRDRLRDSLARLVRHTRVNEFGECKIDTADEFLGVQLQAVIIVLDQYRRRGDNTEYAYIFGGTRRFSMAMSRAKWVVIIIGDFTELDDYQPWKDITEHTCNITL